MPTAKILVVDDEEIVLLSCERVLTEEGYEVQTRLGGQEGLQLLAEEPFDLAIVDLKMPGMDGLELLRAIKRDYPHMPVIMITGFSTVESAVEAMKAGAYDYLPKPFTPDQVAMVVKKALDNRSMMLENLYLRNELQSKYRFENIIGSSQKMQDIYRSGRQSRSHEQHRAHYRRERNGERTHRPGRSFQQPEQRAPIHSRGLCRAFGKPSGKRALRPCQRVIYRSHRYQTRPF